MTKLDELFALAAVATEDEKEGDETVEMVDLEHGNGKDAYLPYYFFETAFFPLKRLGEYTREIASGTIKVTGPSVSVVPHGQIFLATIALAQRSKKILRRQDYLGRSRFEAVLKNGDFYELLGWGSSRKRDLINALVDLASLRVETNFADGRKAVYPLFSFEELKSRGRGGGEILFDFSPIVGQTEATLFASAYTVARLKSPTAVSLFWLFSYRSALALTMAEWHSALGADTRDVSLWGRRTFQSALGELLALGFTAEEREYGKILIRRPPPAKKRNFSFKKG